MIEGQAAIVTGAGQGIGRATALRLARDGADVVVAELNETNAKKVAEEIRALGRKAIALPTDITREADRKRAISTCVEEFGKLDLLVNNAGVNKAQLPRDVTEADWDWVFGVNAKAVWFMAVAALEEMNQRGSGRVINLASQAGKLGYAALGVYSASKAVVVSITKSLALAYAPKLRVNAVCPGVVDTPMWAQLDPELAQITGAKRGEVFAARVKALPLARASTPDDVANVISFLAGPDSEYMTGQAINVTGGNIMH